MPNTALKKVFSSDLLIIERVKILNNKNKIERSIENQYMVHTDCKEEDWTVAQ